MPVAKFTGVAVLSRETGYSQGYISTELKKGRTADQIREKAKRRRGVNVEQANVPAAAPVSRAYVPRNQKPVAVSAPVVSPQPVVVEQEGADGKEGDGETFYQAQQREKIAQANERELKVAILQKDLVSLPAVVVWGSRIVARFKDIGMKIGPENQDKLAACTDPMRCAEIVTDGIRAMLRELEKFATETME